MSESTEGSESHSHSNYVKIWFILLVLLVISVLGPLIGIKAITILTAFGIAIVKAGMVAAYFMHLNIEKRYIWYLLIVALLFLGVLFFGLAPDIMRADGRNWTNPTPAEVYTLDEAEGETHH